MLVTVDELKKTSLYPEIVDAITRRDTSSADMHIASAESFVRSYMSKFDTDTIFDGTLDAKYASSIELVKKLVKIIASYYMVRMANPNVDIELFRLDYQDAIAWLEQLQQGKVSINLPYLPDDPATSEDESSSDVSWNSNRKRKNHF